MKIKTLTSIFAVFFCLAILTFLGIECPINPPEEEGSGLTLKLVDDPVDTVEALNIKISSMVVHGEDHPPVELELPDAGRTDRPEAIMNNIPPAPLL